MDNPNPQQVDPLAKPSQVEKPNVLKKFPGKESKITFSLILASFVVVAVGVATGWFLSGASLGSTNSPALTQTEEKDKLAEGEIGIPLEDASERIKEAEGVLVEGGIEGEGTHHLEREGGVSQNVYLTSTAIDLQSLVGKKVHVWGETLSGIKAGWLMDVVKVKVLD